MQAWYASPFTTKWLLGSIDDTRGWRLWERCMAQLMILRSSKKVFQVGSGGEGGREGPVALRIWSTNWVCSWVMNLNSGENGTKDISESLVGEKRSRFCGHNNAHFWECALLGLRSIWCPLGPQNQLVGCGRTGGVGFWKNDWSKEIGLTYLLSYCVLYNLDLDWNNLFLDHVWFYLHMDMTYDILQWCHSIHDQ